MLMRPLPCTTVIYCMDTATTIYTYCNVITTNCIQCHKNYICPNFEKEYRIICRVTKTLVKHVVEASMNVFTDSVGYRETLLMPVSWRRIKCRGHRGLHCLSATLDDIGYVFVYFFQICRGKFGFI